MCFLCLAEGGIQEVVCQTRPDDGPSAIWPDSVHAFRNQSNFNLLSSENLVCWRFNKPTETAQLAAPKSNAETSTIREAQVAEVEVLQ